MADFTAIHALGTDPAFVNRVKVAAFLEADRVSDEVPTTPNHQKRVEYGTLYVRTPDQEAPKLALAAAAWSQIAGVAANATDLKITQAVRDYWEVFAGVVTT